MQSEKNCGICLYNLIRNQKTKTGLLLAACFVLPCIIMLAALASYGFAPFGDKSLMIMDMSGQYSEFFCGLKNINAQNGGVLFSWSKALGGNYAGVFAYYVASPLSFITLFFSNENMHIGVLVLTVLKIGLSGLTFGILMNHFNKNKARNVIFAIFYAMMSYNIAYSMCLMWLDGVIWLPIIILAIEKIAAGGKPYLLCLSYTFLFVSTYYISYMIGIFSCLYLMYIFVREGVGFLRKSFSFCIKFVGSVVVAAGLGAWLLLPTFFSLFDGKIGNPSIVPDNGVNYELSQIINKFLVGSYDGITNYGTPFFYCGILIFALFFGYFFIKSISVREKITTAAIALFIAVSTYFYEIDIAWHVFQRPNWFPYRYFFLFGFIMIFTAAKAAARFKEIPYVCHIVFALLAAGFLTCIKNLSDNILPKEQYDLTLIFLLINISVLFAASIILKLFNNCKRGHSFRIAGAAMLACFIFVAGAEVYLNAGYIFAGLDRDHRYEMYAEYRDYKLLTEKLIEAAENDSDGEFYRIGTGFQRTFNEPIALGYGGINHYSSSFNKNINDFLKKMGFAQSWYWSSYAGSTAVTDALFSVKYVMIDDEISRMDDRGKIISWCSVPFEHYDVVTNVESAVLYNNPYCLSACIAVSDSLKAFDWRTNSIESQNYLLNCMLDNDYDYFIRLSEEHGEIFTEIGDGCVEYSVEAVRTGPLYAYFQTGSGNATLKIDGKYDVKLYTGETDCVQFLGYYEAGETAHITLETDRANTRGNVFYLLDEALFEDAIDAFSVNSLNIDEWGSGYIKGSVNASCDGVAFTSLAYDDAWDVRVDGKEVETYALKDGLLCFDIVSGVHDIEIEYNVPGFIPGLLISCFTFVLVIFGLIAFRMRTRYFALT